MEIHELVESALRDACDALVPQLDGTAGEREPLGITAIIGFAGDHLRGTIALAAGPAALAVVCVHAQSFGVPWKTRSAS